MLKRCRTLEITVEITFDWKTIKHVLIDNIKKAFILALMRCTKLVKMDIMVSVGEYEVDEDVKFAVKEGIGKVEQELGRGSEQINCIREEAESRNASPVENAIRVCAFSHARLRLKHSLRTDKASSSKIETRQDNASTLPVQNDRLARSRRTASQNKVASKHKHLLLVLICILHLATIIMRLSNITFSYCMNFDIKSTPGVIPESSGSPTLSSDPYTGSSLEMANGCCRCFWASLKEVVFRGTSSPMTRFVK